MFHLTSFSTRNLDMNDALECYYPIPLKMRIPFTNEQCWIWIYCLHFFYQPMNMCKYRLYTKLSTIIVLTMSWNKIFQWNKMKYTPIVRGFPPFLGSCCLWSLSCYWLWLDPFQWQLLKVHVVLDSSWVPLLQCEPLLLLGLSLLFYIKLFLAPCVSSWALMSSSMLF